VIGLASATVLVFTTIQAVGTRLEVDSFDARLFGTINTWPAWLLWPFIIITQLGGLGATVIWAGLGWYLRGPRAAGVIALSGLVGWLIAKPFKVLAGRGRPQDLLDLPRLTSQELFSGMGYPSGHATLAAACITALLFYVNRRQRRYLYFVLLLVGLSRIYLGGHFPRDIIGGFALGALVGSLISLAAGTAKPKLAMAAVKDKLRDLGIIAQSARKLTVDARGSIPIKITAENGQSYFVKLFGKQEYTADWLFKTLRFFKFKSLSDGRPYLNSKHNIEHEALAALWAKRAKVNTPEIQGYTAVGSYWMLVQEGIEATALDKLVGSKIPDQTLFKVWQEVSKLHDTQMAHRDLRAANIMIDRQDRPWLIDFGFAEVASRPINQKIDIAELLMSMSLTVGVDRTITAARRAMGVDRLVESAPYVQISVFSSATTVLVRKNKALLEELQTTLTNLSPHDEIVKADVLRFNPKVLLNIGILALFLFVIVPQLGAFKGALGSLGDLDNIWLLPILGTSALTYLSAAMITVSLAPIPLKFRTTLLAQVAASFASKLLPAGLGSLTLFVRYLKNAGLKLHTASSVMMTENILGFATFLLPMAAMLIIRGQSITSLIKLSIGPATIAVVAVTLLVVLAVIWQVKHWRQKVLGLIAKTWADFQSLASSPKELALAGLFSMAVTAAYVSCLYFCLRALNLDASPLVALVVYATATIAGSASPTPGGLGALEVAMAITLVGLGFPQSESYATVILYRLSTFWAPIPFGFAAYQYLQKKRLV
jgi:glycosyltransferase 2 family protein